MYTRVVAALAMSASAGCGFEHGSLNGGSTPTADAPADPTDGSIDDTPPAARCPDFYVSGYRITTTLTTWLDAEHACEADSQGLTHLVVFDDDGERAAIALVIQPVGDAWVGIVRDPGGNAPWPWRYVTGGAATFAPWESSEPNNMSGDQYVAVLRQSSSLMYDYGALNLEYAVCECDKKPAVNADYDPATN